MEWMDKYRKVPREETALTIDRPMIIFLGMTVTDILAATLPFMAIMYLSDSVLSILIGFVVGGVSAWLSRECRARFPRRFLQHFAWSLGQNTLRGVPVLFKRRRYRLFGP